MQSRFPRAQELPNRLWDVTRRSKINVCGVDGLLGGVIADGFHENPSASEQAAPDDSEASGLPSGSQTPGLLCAPQNPNLMGI